MKKLTIYIISLTMLGTFPGCKKFLETLPDNRTVVTTPDQVAQLLTTAYPHANYIPFCEAMSDNAEDKGNASSDLINLQSFKFTDVQSTDIDSPEAYFHACYNAIAAANQALVFCNNADSASYSAQKGEALVARAYAHFMLVTLFARSYDPATASSDPGIPYVTTVEKHVFQQYERKTVQYDYDMIEADLNRGLSLIQDKIYGTAPKFHFTQQAAHAFAARFYLFKKNYAMVAAHASSVFGSGNVANLLRFWNGTSASSNPVGYSGLQYDDLQATYTKSTENSNVLLQEANTIWGRSYPGLRFGYGNNLFNQFYNTLNVTGGDFAEIRNTYGANPQSYNIPKFYENFVATSLNGTTGDPYNVVPLFSMEEVLLNRVEAYARLNNYAVAVADLNSWISKNIVSYTTTNNVTAKKIASYYGTSDTASAIVATALYFKKVSYLHEGLRWFDILRLKLPVTHVADGVTYTLTADDKRKLLQLPAEVAQAGLALNPR